MGYAQLTWVTKILGITLTDHIDLLETEREHRTKPLSTWFRDFRQFSRCPNREYLNNKTETETDTSLAELIVISPGKLRSRLLNGYLRPSGCRLCGRGVNLTYEYVVPTVTPPFIVYSCDGLFQNTCPDGNHYFAVLIHGDDKYVYDDTLKKLKSRKKYDRTETHVTFDLNLILMPCALPTNRHLY
ncbi:unnamed protein product [Allacma fusca]|uniref:Uncharacterized protein n=1 Tax=Allacma fusca TaxID=39272 RepID=A0A8J2NWJ8_9HEXA|nr:unnamed protein product [Allacma fusca]